MSNRLGRLRVVASQQVHAYVTPGRCPCCGRDRAAAVRRGIREELAQLGLADRVLVEVHAEDLGHCGVLLVLHPCAALYRYRNRREVREILQEHFGRGRIAWRLYLGCAQ